MISDESHPLTWLLFCELVPASGCPSCRMVSMLECSSPALAWSTTCTELSGNPLTLLQVKLRLNPMSCWYHLSPCSKFHVEIRIPRSLSSTTDLRSLFPSEYSCLIFFGPKCITPHLSILNAIDHLFARSNSLSRSVCICWKLASEPTSLINLLSSMNFSSMLDISLSLSSFINI